MKCLPTAKVVDTCPGCHRPVVIDLPVKGTHTAASVTSPVVYSILHGHSLKDLAHIEKLAEILRITEILGKIIQDLSVSCRIFLVVLHHPGKIFLSFSSVKLSTVFRHGKDWKPNSEQKRK